MNNLQKYEQICNDLTIDFIEKYYCDEDIQLKDVYCEWVAQEVGGVACINDEFWSMNDIVNVFKYKPTKKQLFEFYYHRLDAKIPQYNLKNFIKLRK